MMSTNQKVTVEIVYTMPQWILTLECSQTGPSRYYISVGRASSLTTKIQGPALILSTKLDASRPFLHLDLKPGLHLSKHVQTITTLAHEFIMTDPKTPTKKKDTSKPENHHNNTVKRSKVRGTIEFLRHFGLLGRGQGQVTTGDVFDFYEISKTQGWSMLKSRLEDKNLTLRPPDFKDTKKRKREDSPDCRTLRNDHRFIDARGGNRKAGTLPATQGKSLSPHEVESVDRWLTDCAEYGPPGALWDLFRKPWVQIVAETGIESNAAEQTMVSHFMPTGWYNCREQVKIIHHHDHERSRYDYVKQENQINRWTNPAWYQDVYSASEWHFQMGTKDGLEPSRPEEQAPQSTTGESSAAGPARDYDQIAQDLYREMDLQAAANRQHFSAPQQYHIPLPPPAPVHPQVPVIMVDVPASAQRKPRGPAGLFVKKPDAEQKVAHCLVIAGADGYKSRLYWYDQPTNDVGKMNAELYKVLYEAAFADIRQYRHARGLNPHNWVLWEHEDPTHTSKAVLAWKKSKGYECYSYGYWAPDTAPTEDPSLAWTTQLHVARCKPTNVNELRNAANDGWACVRPETIRGVFGDIARRLGDIEREYEEKTAEGEDDAEGPPEDEGASDEAAPMENELAEMQRSIEQLQDSLVGIQ